VSGVQAELAGPAIVWFARPRPAASASPARVVGLTSSVLFCTATSRRFGVRGASPRIALTELTWRRFAEGGCVPGRWRSRAADGMLVLAWFFPALLAGMSQPGACLSAAAAIVTRPT
jgi:hypothetical protein